MVDIKKTMNLNNLTGFLPKDYSIPSRKPVVFNDEDNPMLYLRLSEYKFLRDDPAFQSYVQRNLWETRTERGYKSHDDVFMFILETYKPWLGKGLLQSDFLVLDRKLYAQLQKKLSALRKNSLVPEWIATDLPKERSEAAIQQTIDPQRPDDERAARKFLRERQRAYRNS